MFFVRSVGWVITFAAQILSPITIIGCMITDNDLEARVIAAIKTVYDPEIPVDVYELGLIYEIKLFPINNVYIRMTLTSPACPSAGTIPGEIEAAVRKIEGIADVQMELTFEPPYSQDMMSEIARLELGYM